jgi:FMN-dependent NADH-azoreductase
MNQVEFVYAEGLAMGAKSRESAIANAHAAIDRMAETELLAA